MKNPLIVSLAALALSAVCLAAVLWRGHPAEPGAGQSAVPVAAVPDSDLRARLEALSAENDELRDRIAMLELRPAAPRTSVTGGFVTAEDFEAFRDEVRAALPARSALAGDAAAESPEFEARVADTLSRIQREKAVAGVRQWHEKRLGQMDGTLARLESRLGLTAQQSDRMRSALLAQYDREAEIVRRWEAGEDEGALGELKAGDREALRADLSRFLSPEQVETYLSHGSDK